ncbi:MAG TPA: dolichyl-phosphate beta-glucosyltransferase [Chloroflexota bacterium]|jgi:dolichyl-phosphate beta-glucosyltransferase|nr:dolichyl-phosphate beta-glucosyltransferase [Chloroflexota bacterium]
MDAPRLSIVIPAYNEAARLPTTLQQLQRFLDGWDYPTEIVVVDDGSTDTTAAVVRQVAAVDARVRLLAAPHRGKGAAVRQGILAARGVVRVMCDADLSMPVQELPKLLAPLWAGADIAYATREGAGARRVGEPWMRRVMGRAFNWLVRTLALPGVDDSQCGFKAFTAASAEALFRHATIDGFGFDVEVLYLARQHGLHLAPVPILWCYHANSRVHPLRDTVLMFRDVLHVRWNHWWGRYGACAPEPHR